MATPNNVIEKKPKEKKPKKKAIKSDINIIEKIRAEIKPLNSNHIVFRLKNVFRSYWRITFSNPETYSDLTSVFLEVDKDNNLTIIEDGRRKFFNTPMIKSAIKF